MVKVATKTCSNCHACKPVALFWKKRNQCKVCRAAIKRKCYQKNKEKVAARRREYRQEHREEIAAYNREYRQENKEKFAAYNREYGQEHKETIAARRRKYCQEHREEINATRRERYAKDPAYAMKFRLRNRMASAVKAAGLDNKCASTIELLGISPQGLKEWLEAQFTEGMTWENRSDWHVDHRVPCDAFDLSDETNQRICFWYKNLQPMWAEENMEKSNKYNDEDKQALISAYCNQ
jgi:hypothetical protein